MAYFKCPYSRYLALLPFQHVILIYTGNLTIGRCETNRVAPRYWRLYRDEDAFILRVNQSSDGGKASLFTSFFRLRQTATSVLHSKFRNKQLEEAKQGMCNACTSVEQCQLTPIPLVQLLEAANHTQPDTGRNYSELATPSGMADIALYAKGIGPHKRMILGSERNPTAANVSDLAESPFVLAAHAAGLAVHVWTLRREPQ